MQRKQSNTTIQMLNLIFNYIYNNEKIRNNIRNGVYQVKEEDMQEVLDLVIQRQEEL